MFGVVKCMKKQVVMHVDCVFLCRENYFLLRVSCCSCNSVELLAREIPSQPVLEDWREGGCLKYYVVKKGIPFLGF
jgi:hypothetical protein